MRLVLVAALGLLAASGSAAHPSEHKSEAAPSALSPSAKPAAAVVDAFHAALQRGDTRAAANLIADDALIFEEGGAEHGKAEYVAHHLPADAEFSKAVGTSVTRRAGAVTGKIAWIATEGRMTGTYKNKPIDRLTTETTVLRHGSGGWRIVHAHWSSAQAH